MVMPMAWMMARMSVYCSVVRMGLRMDRTMEQWIDLARMSGPELGCTKAIELGFWRG
jgi:hypothetical protein